MSHFTVLVIGKNPEEQLKPFQENNMGDCPKKYLKFNDIEDENLNDYKTGTVDKVKMPDGRLLNKWDDEFKVAGKIGIGTDTHKVPKGLPIVKAKYTELYKTFEEYMKDWCGYEERDAKKKRYGYWENPNAKWDWYQLGGRWTGHFKVKKGAEGTSGRPGLGTEAADPGYVDQAYKRDIDWRGMVADRIRKARKTWAEYEAAKKSGDKKALYKFWFDPGTTKESYIKDSTKVSTFALIKGGKWYEKGQMGWWACVANEKDQERWDEEFQKVIESASDDTLLSVYDCHI